MFVHFLCRRSEQVVFYYVGLVVRTLPYIVNISLQFEFISKFSFVISICIEVFVLVELVVFIQSFSNNSIISVSGCFLLGISVPRIRCYTSPHTCSNSVFVRKIVRKTYLHLSTFIIVIAYFIGSYTPLVRRSESLQFIIAVKMIFEVVICTYV